MRPAETVERFIENVPLETRAERDREVLDDALRALQESKKHAELQPNVWKAIMRSKMTKLAAAAAIIITVFFTVNSFDDTSAWAQIACALDEVENARIDMKTTTANGNLIETQFFFKKPYFLREDRPENITIDDGVNFLFLNKQNETAQFRDSLSEWQPISKHPELKMLGLFRGEETEGFELRKLAGESNETTLVYSVKYEDFVTGKAWVDAVTMLPLRMEVSLTGELEPNAAKEGNAIFSYDPIPDEVFEQTVPDGYTVLPRKRAQAISGKVVDVDGTPVQGATVHLTDKGLRFLRKAETDNAGEFLFKLPPSKVHWVGLPMFLRAVPPNDADRVAWTIIEDPAKKKDRGVAIPGQPGHVEMNTGLKLQGVNGIVLQMASAGTISGCVTDMQGKPLSGAEVKVEGRAFAARKPGMPLFPEFGFIGHPLGGDGPRGELTTHTDAQGRYEVTNVPKLSKRNWYKVVAGAGGFSSNAQRIESRWKSGIEKVDVKLYHSGITVSGTLVDNYGRILEMREIRGRVGGRDFCRTMTDEKGRFVLKDCPISPKLQIKANLAQNTWMHLGKEKSLSYAYYPNVIVPIDYEEGTMEYDVKLVAEKPEFTVELEVKNTTGEPVVHYPIELQGASASTSPEWQERGRLTQRTDSGGYCKFTNAPNLEGLRLVVGRAHIFNDALSEEDAEKAKRENAGYQWTIVPVDVKPGQKEYRIEVTLLTKEEFEAMR